MIYKAFEQSDIVSGRSVKVSTGFFDGSLTQVQNTFESSSTQDVISGSNRFDVYNGYYYTDVYSTATPKDQTAATQIFSIAYGNVNGYGTSYDEYTNIKAHPTRAIWQQYVNELNGGGVFSVKSQAGVGGTVSSVPLSTDFMAISFNPQKFKDTMDPGQFQMTLLGSAVNKSWRIIDDSSLIGQNSGSNGVYNLILGQINDDGTIKYWKPSAGTAGGYDGGLTSAEIGSSGYSGLASETSYYPPGVGSSGTSGDAGAIDGKTTVGGIGLFYPKAGVIILNVDFLARISVGATPPYHVIPPLSQVQNSGNYRSYFPTATYNTKNQSVKADLYEMITSTPNTEKMRIRYSEYIPSRHYFVRVKNREFNYTNNATFAYQSSAPDPSNGEFHQKGDIIQTDFLSDPKVYPTSIGLYNTNNELVAVAKLSNPAQKSFTNELLIKVRLDF